MNVAERDNGQQRLLEGAPSVSAAFEGSGEDIAVARELSRDFLTSLQAVHGLPVSSRAMGMVQLVVSELVTNAGKYAPGPCVLTLSVSEGAVEVTVWDSGTTLPAILAPDPNRIGQHGLEIVMAVCRSFEVRREPVGKRMTAAVVLADDPGGDAAGRQMM
ncbi:ATP-binding protein [Streptomyces sp. G44]|uniref:ATP-binding protein n=1 Tax=Streptomyces sp. G44 TaxID=2807632 RepID=UPI00196088ED|nr:ATP-binding protein [Streptomyces sp. G44]MBM7168910.1 ATP-binding protein [Streptomyces sp. G44]